MHTLIETERRERHDTLIEGANSQLHSALELAAEATGGPEGVVDWLMEELARGGLNVRADNGGFSVWAR
jgi:hypothetical protein